MSVVLKLSAGGDSSLRHFMHAALLALALIVVSACENARLRAVYDAFCQENITIPQDLLLVQDGELLDSYTIPEVPRLVYYLDSNQCSVCNITKLQKLHVDPSEPLYVASIVQLPQKDREYVKMTIEYAGLDVDASVFLDENDSFIKNNPFLPDDRRFHTFLLDPDGNIRLVGDPTAGDKLEKMFQETIHLINQSDETK